jgi:hypothetical protein
MDIHRHSALQKSAFNRLLNNDLLRQAWGITGFLTGNGRCSFGIKVRVTLHEMKW